MVSFSNALYWNGAMNCEKLWSTKYGAEAGATQYVSVCKAAGSSDGLSVLSALETACFASFENIYIINNIYNIAFHS